MYFLAICNKPTGVILTRVTSATEILESVTNPEDDAKFGICNVRVISVFQNRCLVVKKKISF